MIKVNKKSVGGKWYKYPEDKDIEIKIKPFPLTRSVLEFDTSGKKDEDIRFAQLLFMFKECVVDWKGLTDDDDKPLKCNNENKVLIFENIFELVNFVIGIVNSDENKFIKQAKN